MHNRKTTLREVEDLWSIYDRVNDVSYKYQWGKGYMATYSIVWQYVEYGDRFRLYECYTERRQSYKIMAMPCSHLEDVDFFDECSYSNGRNEDQSDLAERKLYHIFNELGYKYALLSALEMDLNDIYFETRASSDFMKQIGRDMDKFIRPWLLYSNHEIRSVDAVEYTQRVLRLIFTDRKLSDYLINEFIENTTKRRAKNKAVEIKEKTQARFRRIGEDNKRLNIKRQEASMIKIRTIAKALSMP
jgi:hypothetical protein